MTKISGPVPCNGCRACCQGNHPVMLSISDNSDDYEVTLEPVTPSVAKEREGDALIAPLEMFTHIPPEDVARIRAQGATHMAMNLRRKPNGDCVYLGDNGCTIYDRRPKVCREFDCRAVFASLTRAERRQWIKTDFLSKEVFDAGRQRLQRPERAR